MGNRHVTANPRKFDRTDIHRNNALSASYTASPVLPPVKINTRRALKDFDRYAKDGVIDEEGVAALIADVGVVDLDDVRAGWVAWLVDAVDLRIEREQFLDGCQRAGVSSVEELRQVVPSDPLHDRPTAKKMFIFAFASNVEPKQRRIGWRVASDAQRKTSPCFCCLCFLGTPTWW